MLGDTLSELLTQDDGDSETASDVPSIVDDMPGIGGAAELVGALRVSLPHFPGSEWITCTRITRACYAHLAQSGLGRRKDTALVDAVEKSPALSEAQGFYSARNSSCDNNFS